jgi:hypothetical protein
VFTHIDFLALTKYTAGSQLPVWPKPGKEPLVDVDRAVLVAVHHQAAVLILAAIHPFPQGHVLLALADVTCLRRIVLIYYREFFPKAQTLVGQHLHKAIEPPIIICHAVAYLPLAPFFGGLVPLILDDHLPLGEIADHHSPFSQSVCDEMGGFMQTVLLLTPLLLCYPLIHLGEMDVAAGLLLALVPFRADFIQLFVVPAVALKSTDVVEAPLVVDACG